MDQSQVCLVLRIGRLSFIATLVQRPHFDALLVQHQLLSPPPCATSSLHDCHCAQLTVCRCTTCVCVSLSLSLSETLFVCRMDGYPPRFRFLLVPYPDSLFPFPSLSCGPFSSSPSSLFSIHPTHPSFIVAPPFSFFFSLSCNRSHLYSRNPIFALHSISLHTSSRILTPVSGTRSPPPSALVSSNPEHRSYRLSAIARTFGNQPCCRPSTYSISVAASSAIHKQSCDSLRDADTDHCSDTSFIRNRPDRWQERNHHHLDTSSSLSISVIVTSASSSAPRLLHLSAQHQTLVN